MAGAGGGEGDSSPAGAGEGGELGGDLLLSAMTTITIFSLFLQFSTSPLMK